ncbi:hypothetical protein PRSY57_1452500 [Plasmodium reichenowi]|uniref:Leucine-rich repeat protein n=1 Tax=Plasmodium reichenowi TaxID=5854 RepID=A0A151L5H1_PLARE|nr:hypothetical protein PRSY57_1452500 [Plasmodium reichenowi]KYN94182.1 hypothetical protein PRSY57_1452500 [Plasmodium reichenowi]
MDESLILPKNRLKNLNCAFLSTTEYIDDNVNDEHKIFSNGNKNLENESINFYKNENNYIKKIDNIENNGIKDSNLKLITKENEERTFLHPEHIRQKNLEGYNEEYVNVSFLNDLIKVPNEDIRLRQKDFFMKKYDLLHKEGETKKRNNYEYINQTNEYYITNNVEEKMPNTGIHNGKFFHDNNMLQYEDDMKKWTNKSRYLYFIEKEKEKHDNEKTTKFKNISFNNSLIVDKYEKNVYKHVLRDETKIENLILDVLNRNFETVIESDEDERNKDSIIYMPNKEKNVIVRKKVDELNIRKKTTIKKKHEPILDYLHYENFFNDDDINISINSVSESIENSQDMDKKSLIYNEEKREEFEIRDNINILLNKVKNDLYTNDFTRFIPDQFDTDIFLYNNGNGNYEDLGIEKTDDVLKQTTIEMNQQKMNQERELLERYNYVDSLYSPGYYTRITQKLKKQKEKKINIYDLKKIKFYEKIKEEKLQNDRMKKEEEDLIKMRLEQSEDLDNDVNLDEHKISLENRENVSLRKIMDNIKLEGLNNDMDEEGSEKEDTYVTDSSINFETLNNRDLENLKKKYKVMSKSNRVFEEDLRRLKFYICKRLNKKKHIFKSVVKDVKAKEKKKEKIKKIIQVSKQAGFSLLAKIHGDTHKSYEEKNVESDQLDESDLFNNADKNASELNSSAYTYSSLTISSYEHMNIRNIHYNDNTNEKLFYVRDPSINITYLYDKVNFFLIQNKAKINKGILFMELLLYDIKFYHNSSMIDENALLYVFNINENTMVEKIKKKNQLCELILKTVNKNKISFSCSILKQGKDLELICNKIIKRILMVKYIKYFESKSLMILDNAINFFLYEKILDLQNVPYDKIGDGIISLYIQNTSSVGIIDFSNRFMSIQNLNEYMDFAKITHCNKLYLSKNPLFSKLSYDIVKKDIDGVIIHLKNMKLTELYLDFIDLSNACGEYIISNIIQKTEISFLSLMNCGLTHDNITNIINNIKENENKYKSSNIHYLNVEFNKLIYYDVVSLIKILSKLNKLFKKIYIYGNLIQTDIFDISFEFKRNLSIIEVKKYCKHVPNVFNLNNIKEIKDYFYCNLRGFAETFEDDKIVYLYFELYSCYMYVYSPEERLYNIKKISLLKKEESPLIIIGASLNNKEVTIRMKVFKLNIAKLFNILVNDSFLGRTYCYEQINNNREINRNVLNYFIFRGENEIRLYDYNISREDIQCVFKLCKDKIVKNINLNYCYMCNDDLSYFNSLKEYPYGIKVYKLSLCNNLFNSNMNLQDFLNFLSNFIIYFKIDLSNMSIGKNPLIHELLFYLINNTMCKIIMLDNCNLENPFLISVNKNIDQLNENNYLTLLSLRYNYFSSVKELIKFVNNLISKCKSLNTIRIYISNFSEDDMKLIEKNIIKKDILSFISTYALIPSIKKLKRKVLKLNKYKINKDVEYNTELTEREKKLIEQFFDRQNIKTDKEEKKDDLNTLNRYNLNDIKNRNIKYKFKNNKI